MSNPTTSKPDIPSLLRALAQEAEARPAPSLETQAALDWVKDRLQQLAVSAAPAPQLCIGCQNRLASKPAGLLN